MFENVVRKMSFWFSLITLNLPKSAAQRCYHLFHYDDVIMTMLSSQITSLTVVYSIVYSGVNQRKHQSSASLVFVWEIHRGTGEFPAQMASYAENVSIWWRHHVFILILACVIHPEPGSLSNHTVVIFLLDNSLLTTPCQGNAFRIAGL